MKKLFTIIIISLLLLSFAIVSCEKEDLGTASIYGIVTDKTTGEPIKSAGVELLPVGLKTITGTDGRFEFANLKAGSYQVYITQTGYGEVKTSTVKLTQAQALQRDVQLELLPPALRVVNDFRQDISELNFGTAKTDVSRSFNIFNDGAETLKWKITYTADWIKSVSITEGVLESSKTEAIIVIIDRNVLTEVENITTLHITSNNGSKQLTLKVGDFPSKDDSSDNNNPSDDNFSDDDPSNIEELRTFNFNTAKYYVYLDAGDMDWKNAISYCEKLNEAGFDDWYLPSKNELNAMYIKKSEIGGFSLCHYWSSTEIDGNSAWLQDFYSGYKSYINKLYRRRVRCVRKD